MLLKRKISKSMLILLFFAFRTFENIQYQHDVFLLILNCVRIFKAIFNSRVLFKNMTWLAQKQAWYSKKYQTMSKMRLGLVIFWQPSFYKARLKYVRLGCQAFQLNHTTFSTSIPCMHANWLKYSRSGL